MFNRLRNHHRTKDCRLEPKTIFNNLEIDLVLEFRNKLKRPPWIQCLQNQTGPPKGYISTPRTKTIQKRKLALHNKVAGIIVRIFSPKNKTVELAAKVGIENLLKVRRHQNQLLRNPVDPIFNKQVLKITTLTQI